MKEAGEKDFGVEVSLAASHPQGSIQTDRQSSSAYFMQDPICGAILGSLHIALGPTGSAPTADQAPIACPAVHHQDFPGTVIRALPLSLFPPLRTLLIS